MMSQTHVVSPSFRQSVGAYHDKECRLLLLGLGTIQLTHVPSA